MTDIPAISGIYDTSQTRLVLYQSGRMVHTPLQQIIDVIVAQVIEALDERDGLILQGDEGSDFIGLEGDETGILLLN